LARAQEDVDGKNPLRKRQLVAAVKETAEALGNTPAVCRSAYICPLIMSSFEKGQVIDRYFVSVKELMSYRGAGLHPAERSLLRFMKRQNQT
jgi:DNA topoisomerase IB